MGWIYASYDDIQKEYGAVNPKTITQAEQSLIGETDTYDCYLRGECYGYIVEKDGIEIDSCWGFLGDLREMISDMKEYVPKEYQHLFDHIDYGCMEYSENETAWRAAQEKPSIRTQLAGLKGKDVPKPEQTKAHSAPELG